MANAKAAATVEAACVSRGAIESQTGIVALVVARLKCDLTPDKASY